MTNKPYRNPDARKYHYVYRRFCKETGEYYIGVHSTDDMDDGYGGSGTDLKKKLGNHEFDMVPISHHRTRTNALKAEKKEIGDKHVTDPLCLNNMPGGSGGHSWSPRTRKRASKARQKYLARRTPEEREAHRLIMKKALNAPATKAKMQDSARRRFEKPHERRKAKLAARARAKDPDWIAANARVAEENRNNPDFQIKVKEAAEIRTATNEEWHRNLKKAGEIRSQTNHKWRENCKKAGEIRSQTNHEWHANVVKSRQTMKESKTFWENVDRAVEKRRTNPEYARLQAEGRQRATDLRKEYGIPYNTPIPVMIEHKIYVSLDDAVRESGLNRGYFTLRNRIIAGRDGYAWRPDLWAEIGRHGKGAREFEFGGRKFKRLIDMAAHYKVNRATARDWLKKGLTEPPGKISRLTKDQLAEMYAGFTKGEPPASIASRLGLHRSGVRRRYNKWLAEQ